MGVARVHPCGHGAVITLDAPQGYLHNVIMSGPASGGEGLWAAQAGPQEAFINSREFEVVYGGARGGGKTDAALGDFALHARTWGKAAQGLMVRRTRRALDPTIARAHEIYSREGARWCASRSAFEWTSGARLVFRHLGRDTDADGYQGHSYSRVYVEELTQFASPAPVNKLKATVRSPAGAPCGFRATCNPGGVGHHWVKARYVDHGDGVPVIEEIRNPFDGSVILLTRKFIAARLKDNPALLGSDPDYVARLALSGSRPLVQAWLEGDWSVIEGAFFDGWGSRNVLAPFPIPEDWTRFRSLDWGFSAPFSVGWWAVASDSLEIQGRTVRRGALIRYREWYGRGARSGGGAGLTATRVAEGIVEREREAGETVRDGVADPAIFAHTSGPTVQKEMRKAGVFFRAADNTRVGRLGALSGWDQMRARIEGRDGEPDLFVFSTCTDFIRTVPSLQHDPMRPEDLDTRAEDHIADETRYACMSRPLISRPPRPPGVPDDIWRRNWGEGRLSRI